MIIESEAFQSLSLFVFLNNFINFNLFITRCFTAPINPYDPLNLYDTFPLIDDLNIIWSQVKYIPVFLSSRTSNRNSLSYNFTFHENYELVYKINLADHMTSIFLENQNVLKMS